jgi:hypothetical protein
MLRDKHEHLKALYEQQDENIRELANSLMNQTTKALADLMERSNTAAQAQVSGQELKSAIRAARQELVLLEEEAKRLDEAIGSIARVHALLTQFLECQATQQMNTFESICEPLKTKNSISPRCSPAKTSEKSSMVHSTIPQLQIPTPPQAKKPQPIAAPASLPPKPQNMPGRSQQKSGHHLNADAVRRFIESEQDQLAQLRDSLRAERLHLKGKQDRIIGSKDTLKKQVNMMDKATYESRRKGINDQIMSVNAELYQFREREERFQKKERLLIEIEAFVPMLTAKHSSEEDSNQESDSDDEKLEQLIEKYKEINVSSSGYPEKNVSNLLTWRLTEV